MKVRIHAVALPLMLLTACLVGTPGIATATTTPPSGGELSNCTGWISVSRDGAYLLAHYKMVCRTPKTWMRDVAIANRYGGGYNEGAWRASHQCDFDKYGGQVCRLTLTIKDVPGREHYILGWDPSWNATAAEYLTATGFEHCNGGARSGEINCIRVDYYG